MKKGVLYNAIDISEDKIAAVSAVINHRSHEIIDISCELSSSSGIRNGAIYDLGLLAESIALVLNKLSLSSGDKIRPLYVSIAGPGIQSRHSAATIALSERSNKIITSGDIARVNHQAYCLGLNLEEQLLHQFPQEYAIDEKEKALNPAGLYGHKLTADLLLVSALGADVGNLVTAIDRSGFKAKAFILSSYAASLAVVSEEEKRKGCALLDIGFGATHLLVFKDGILRGFEQCAIGSKSITEAIAEELKLSYDLAENLKCAYGNALADNVDPGQEVLVKKDQAYRPIKRKVVCAVIEQRLKKLFSGLGACLATYQKRFDLPCGIIVSGETAKLEGLLESLELNFHLAAHLAKIDPSISLRVNAERSRSIENAPLSDTTFATAVGLVRYAVSQRPQMQLFKLSSYGNIFQKLIHKSREIYHEYF